jgi:hypothetical protein
MRTVPPILPPRATGTEAEVFRLLEQVQSPDGVALCSLNLSTHEYKKWGEIDFVVVSEAGLLVLEVKGGQVYCDRGLWRYESRDRAPVERSESPMAQASSAYFGLRKHLYQTVGQGVIDEAATGFGVILGRTSLRDAEARSLLGGSEMVRPLVGTKEDVQGGVDVFGELLHGFHEYWRKQMHRAPRTWSTKEVVAVVAALRPWFDRVAPLSISVARVREEQLALTAEQYQVLDFSHAADRVLVTGGAGCGKTLLAVECLRRERCRNPLLVTGTESLARHLRASLVDDPSRVYSFQELSKVPRHRRRTHGSLIVDEGQQVTNAESIAALSTWLEGGLERGRWRWFSDPNNQVLPDANFDPEQHEFLRRNSFPGTLTRNCRTTPQIAHSVQLLTGVAIGDSTTKGQGPDVSFAPAASRAGQMSAAATTVSKWLEDPEIRPGDIVLLSPKRPGDWSVPEIAKQAGLPWRPWQPGWGASSEHRGSLAAATVEEFRGMESPFVVLCDMDASVQEPASCFYLGMTRANFGLMVVADAVVVQQLVTKAGS